jgi:hypothetical protein
MCIVVSSIYLSDIIDTGLFFAPECNCKANSIQFNVHVIQNILVSTGCRIFPLIEQYDTLSCIDRTPYYLEHVGWAQFGTHLGC